MKNKKSNKTREYTIGVERVCTRDFTVEAESFKEARSKALQAAYDTDWGREVADYFVENEDGEFLA